MIKILGITSKNNTYKENEKLKQLQNELQNLLFKQIK